MDNQQLYIIPLSKYDDIHKKILAIKASLGDKQHEINILTNSIAVIVEELQEEKIILEDYKVNTLNKDTKIYEKDNVQDYNNYTNFIYEMKKINRAIKA